MVNCIICKSEQLIKLNEVEEISYKNTILHVYSEYTKCENCGNEFISKEQGRKNDLCFMEAKHKADGLMSPDEIKRARIKLGLTQAMAAKIFGGGDNAFSKYERGEITQSAAMDKLIRLCLVNQINLQYLKENNNVGSKISDIDFLLSTKNSNCDPTSFLKVN
jgi:HTH-type transcriptional regulator/antitoxin MqsA